MDRELRTGRQACEDLGGGAGWGGGECFRRVEERVQRPFGGNKHWRLSCKEAKDEVRGQIKLSLVGW